MEVNPTPMPIVLGYKYFTVSTCTIVLLLTFKTQKKGAFFSPISFHTDMEHMEAISEREWSSFNRLYSPQEAEFVAQNGSLSFEVPSSMWPFHDSTMNMVRLAEGSCCFSTMSNSNFQSASHFSGGSLSQQSCFMSDSHLIHSSNGSSVSMDFCVGRMKNSSSFLVEGNDSLDQEMSDGNPEESAGYTPESVSPNKDSYLIRGSQMSASHSIMDDPCNNPPEKPRKRSRSSGDVSILGLLPSYHSLTTF